LWVRISVAAAEPFSSCAVESSVPSLVMRRRFRRQRGRRRGYSLIGVESMKYQAVGWLMAIALVCGGQVAWGEEGEARSKESSSRAEEKSERNAPRERSDAW